MQKSKKSGSVAFWIILLIFSGWYFFIRSNSNEPESSLYYPSEPSSYEATCSEPQNPYSYGTGHYAGWEWGEEGNYCSGNSNSFIEGCGAYEEADEIHTQCLDKN